MSSEKNSKASNEFISAGKDINVDEIMEAVTQRIEEKKKAGVLKQVEIDEIEEMELQPLPDFLEIPNVYEQHLYPHSKGGEYEPTRVEYELEDASGLKGLFKRFLQKVRGTFMWLIRFLARPLENELKELTVRLHNENKEKVVPLIPLVHQSKEYIKLLHNTSNNTIVEFSKLKIETELLKTKIRVLEDKLAFLENRERAIEKKVFEK